MTSNPVFARDKISQVYFGTAGDEFSQAKSRARIDWIAEQINGSPVLDIGCSEGVLPILLGRKGIDVFGVDINPEAISFAKNLLEQEKPETQLHIQFECADIIDSSWKARQTYAFIILGEVIEHFPDPSVLIQRAIEFLEPDGTMIITTPFGYFPDPDHKITFSLRTFIEYVKGSLSPVSLEIVDGYIRFIGTKSQDNRDRWGWFEQNIVEQTEQGLFAEQRRYWEMVNGIRTKLGQQNNQLNQQHNQLNQQYNQLNQQYKDLLNAHQKKIEQLHQVEIKYRGLMARYKTITASLSYRLGQEFSMAFRPPKPKAILWLPFKSIGLILKWAQDKSVFKRIKNKLLKVLNPKYVPFDFQTQEDNFYKQVTEFIQLAGKNTEKPVVVISSTTKRIGVQKRLNRPMAFAQELKRLNIPVIYVYYRWKPSEDQNPQYDGGPLLQLPNDLFHKWANEIAHEVTNSKKLFLISIPDVNSTSELELFRLKGWRVGYEVRDEWSEFNKAGVGNWYNTTFEIYLATNADFVTAVSNRLHEKMVSFGANPETTEIIPNGLNTDFLEMAAPIFKQRAGGFRGKGTIGYFGHLTEKWFNWGLLQKIAKNHPEWQFEIIGFDAPTNLHIPHNIKLLGEKTHPEIIKIAQNWSLAIIPFKNNELARAVDPIKLYEYLALGLPCVSCLMDQIKGYPFTFIYDDDRNFETLIEEGLKFAPTKQDWDFLEKFVAANTWKNRVIRTLQIGEISVAENEKGAG